MVFGLILLAFVFLMCVAVARIAYIKGIEDAQDEVHQMYVAKTQHEFDFSDGDGTYIAERKEMNQD